VRQASADLIEKKHLIVWALLAGALWAVANTLTVFAIRDVGLAVAFPMWNANALIGLFWGRVPFRELEGASGKNIAKVVVGAIAIVIAAEMLGFSTIHGGGSMGSHAFRGIFHELGDDRTPYLLFDRNFPHLAAHFVGSDDVQVGEMATRHLIDIGRKRIAHIGGKNTSPAFDRLRGYRNALAEGGFPAPESLVVVRERMEESGDVVGFQAMQELLKVESRPDAVFCYNDLTAVGAIEATLQAGLRVPQDIAIIESGNLRYANYPRVPLSSIDHGTAELGRMQGSLRWSFQPSRSRSQKVF
jgi:hypothetical protein